MHKYLPEKDVCVTCAKKTAKWLAYAYTAHWIIHIIAFAIYPPLGALLLLMF